MIVIKMPICGERDIHNKGVSINITTAIIDHLNGMLSRPTGIPGFSNLPACGTAIIAHGTFLRAINIHFHRTAVKGHGINPRNIAAAEGQFHLCAHLIAIANRAAIGFTPSRTVRPGTGVGYTGAGRIIKGGCMGGLFCGSPWESTQQQRQKAQQQHAYPVI